VDTIKQTFHVSSVEEGHLQFPKSPPKRQIKLERIAVTKFTFGTPTWGDSVRYYLEIMQSILETLMQRNTCPQ